MALNRFARRDCAIQKQESEQSPLGRRVQPACHAGRTASFHVHQPHTRLPSSCTDGAVCGGGGQGELAALAGSAKAMVR